MNTRRNSFFYVMNADILNRKQLKTKIQMAIYKYGRYRQYGWNDGVEGTIYHIIKKKTLFGWREYEWWRGGDKGYAKMMICVEELRNRGNTVYED